MWVCCWEVDRQFPPYREGMIRRAGEGNRYREGGMRGRVTIVVLLGELIVAALVGLVAAVAVIVGLLLH